MSDVLLYMHGFRSSPLSAKARILGEHCRAHGVAFSAPDLSVAPLAAVQRLQEEYERLASTGARVVLAGSSLGGFYCVWLAERTGARAALIFSAVSPWRVVKNYLGEQTIYGTTRTIYVSGSYESELLKLRTPAFDDPSLVLLVLATRDELLDRHEAAALYAASPSIVVDGSAHGMSDFEAHAEVVLRFLLAETHARDLISNGKEQ